MNTTAHRLTLFLLIPITLIMIASCEGGKARNIPCDSGAPSQYTTGCQACPSGQVYVNGYCEFSKSRCTSGYELVNNACVRSCPMGKHLEGGSCVDDDIDIEVVNLTQCSTTTGRFQFIVDFIARDEQGYTIDPVMNSENEPTVLTSNIFIDDDEPNVEALIDRKSELLQSDLVLSLVLDSSLSMLSHTPPAFEPMKTAAISILSDTQATWAKTNSMFAWELSWFNDFIHRPTDNLAGESWQINDIAQIPEPLPEHGATSLYKAVVQMAGVHKDLYANGVAVQERDQHIMIVLSDGEDTLSNFDNSMHLDMLHNEDQTLFWDQFGYPVTTMTNIQVAFSEIPNLKTHVIGLGEDVVDTELENIANYGNGLYFSGATSENLDEVFKNVQKEFITVQTVGVQTPLSNGDYIFSLRVEHVETGARGVEDFRVNVGSGIQACE